MLVGEIKSNVFDEDSKTDIYACTSYIIKIVRNLDFSDFIKEKIYLFITTHVAFQFSREEIRAQPED